MEPLPHIPVFQENRFNVLNDSLINAVAYLQGPFPIDEKKEDDRFHETENYLLQLASSIDQFVTGSLLINKTDEIYQQINTTYSFVKSLNDSVKWAMDHLKSGNKTIFADYINSKNWALYDFSKNLTKNLSSWEEKKFDSLNELSFPKESLLGEISLCQIPQEELSFELLANPTMAILQDLFNSDRCKILTKNEGMQVLEKIKDAKDFNLAAKLIQKLLGAEHKVDKFLINNLLSKNTFSESDWACKLYLFEKIRKRFGLYPDAYTYSSFIKTAGEHGKYEEILKAFGESRRKGKGCINAVTCSLFIKYMGEGKNFKAAKKIFYDVLKTKINVKLTSEICNCFIKTAGDCGEYYYAKFGFGIAKVKGVSDSVSYSTFFKVAGDLCYFQDAKMEFDEVKKQNIHINIIAYNTFIQAAGNAKQYGEVIKAYKELSAREEGFADFYTYNILIKEAIKYGDANLAKIIYQEGQQKKLINSYTQNKWVEYQLSEIKVEKALNLKDKEGKLFLSNI